MQVTLYAPARFYGFARSLDSNDEVFFHLRDFRWGEGPPRPPPISGELVDVEYDPDTRRSGNSPPASRVTRVQNPEIMVGEVEHFNNDKGFGFVVGSDGQSYFLHRSDIEDNLIPVKGDEVQFYPGVKRERPRACYVALIRKPS